MCRAHRETRCITATLLCGYCCVWQSLFVDWVTSVFLDNRDFASGEDTAGSHRNTYRFDIRIRLQVSAPVQFQYTVLMALLLLLLE